MGYGVILIGAQGPRVGKWNGVRVFELKCRSAHE
jgi:hypothetical protein